MNGFILIPLMMVLPCATASILCLWHRTILFNEMLAAREQIDERRSLLERIQNAACETVARDRRFFSQVPGEVRVVIAHNDAKTKLTVVSSVQKKRLVTQGTLLPKEYDEVLALHTVASDNGKPMSSSRCYLAREKTAAEKASPGVVVFGYTFVNLM